MSGVFDNAIRYFEYYGVLDVILPFIIIFTIVFAVLQKTPILKEKRFNVMVALVVALVPVFQHVMYKGSRYDVITIMNKAIPQVALIVIGIIMLLIILGIFGGMPQLGENKISAWITIVGLIIIVYIFGSSAGFGWWDLPYWFRSTEVYTIIVALIVFGLVLSYITSDDKEKKKDTFIDEFAKLFKGKKE